MEVRLEDSASEASPDAALVPAIREDYGSIPAAGQQSDESKLVVAAAGPGILESVVVAPAAPSEDEAIPAHWTGEHIACLTIVKELGFEDHKIRVAIEHTGSLNPEQIVTFILSNPDAIYHKFMPHSMNRRLCVVCLSERAFHLIDERGPIIAGFDMASPLGVFDPLADYRLVNSPLYYEDSVSEDSEHERKRDKDKMIEEMKANAALALAKLAIEDDAKDKPDGDDKPKMYCGICMDEIALEGMADAPCGHRYCNDCLTGHFNVKVKEADVVKLKCIDPDCGRIFTDAEIRGFLKTDELIKKYEKFKKNKELAENPNCKWCPTPGCETPMFGSIIKPKLTCPTCKVSICFKCGEKWHGRKKCSEVVDEQFKDWAKGRDVQPCPKCKAKIWKDDGCNHMTCFQCKHEFCWLCRSRYSSYHFEWWNVFGCPGAQFALESEGSFRPNLLCIWGYRFLVFVLILLGIALLIALAGTALALALAALPFYLCYLCLACSKERWDNRQRERVPSIASPPLNPRDRMIHQGVRRNPVPIDGDEFAGRMPGRLPRRVAPLVDPEEAAFQRMLAQAIQESLKQQEIDAAKAAEPKDAEPIDIV